MKFKNSTIRKEILEAIRDLGYEEMTSIQSKSIPILQEGKDLIGQSETGSGKTLAFSIPIIEKIQVGKGIQALIVLPTRELANQVKEEISRLSKYKKIQITSIYGGVSIEPQIQNLQRTEVVVGTPGRLLDHLERRTINLFHVKFLVLDEADRMLDMGFIDDVERLVRACPKEKQTMLFSATIPYEIERLSKRYLQNPEIVRTRKHVKEHLLKQIYYDVLDNEKFSLLLHLIKKFRSEKVMVFCARRTTTDIIASNLQKHGIPAKSLHGGIKQATREKLLDEFHKNKIPVLVVTDVASRGLDIKDVEYVINYNVPEKSDDYTHRIGRTARAGAKGKAVTLLSPPDFEAFRRVTHDNNIFVDRAEPEKYRKVPFHIRSFPRAVHPSKRRKFSRR